MMRDNNFKERATTKRNYDKKSRSFMDIVVNAILGGAALVGGFLLTTWGGNELKNLVR